MKYSPIKIICGIFIALAIGLAITSFWSNSAEGQYSLFKRNLSNRAISIAESRDMGLEKAYWINEYRNWGDHRHTVQRQATFEAIEFIYRNPGISPEIIGEAILNKVDAKKNFWMRKLVE